MGSKIQKLYDPVDEDRKEDMKDSLILSSGNGVEHEFQGKGFGGKLLRSMFTRNDEKGIPVYLETETEYKQILLLMLDSRYSRTFLPESNLILLEMLRESQNK
jgi:GNAT superfamily N-acetyltransferase